LKTPYRVVAGGGTPSDITIIPLGFKFYGHMILLILKEKDNRGE